jgi:hypothetical protein
MQQKDKLGFFPVASGGAKFAFSPGKRRRAADKQV